MNFSLTTLTEFNLPYALIIIFLLIRIAIELNRSVAEQIKFSL